ncbi:uncharacterized protein LOC129770934 isoform X2 [Toxorhynchites rutilus septentrionalis]|uniref:uncharacterized protein LOC129770934 isoform X2 n=1 Tax=Toxorhynchites rutilus septentrionalis TaxID=329112 RepID=UPI00247972F4|nr:uncharacterized protein LOC129770934 isoform X2 [Toxorhynchites rutilus septentrionalis]
MLKRKTLKLCCSLISLGSANILLVYVTIIGFMALVIQLCHTQDINNATEDLINGRVVNQPTDSEQQRNGQRSSILDNIFNIPIQTLKAVNDLVQSIAGNLQAAGSGTYFRSRHDRTRNINVNIDDNEEAKKD